MAEPETVKDVTTLVDRLGEVYDRLAIAQADLARNDAQLELAKAAMAAVRDRDRYAHDREDFFWRSLRMLVVLVLILGVVFWDSNEQLLRDLFRPRPTVDLAEHVSALVDTKDTTKREDHIRQIHACKAVLDRVVPSWKGGGDGTNTRITDADKAELNAKCKILIER